MPKAHLDTQRRICAGGITVVTGQSSLTVDGLLWAVNGDPNNHTGGNLAASVTDVKIEGKLVIIHKPDTASSDGQCPIPGGNHCAPATDEGFDDVFVY